MRSITGQTIVHHAGKTKDGRDLIAFATILAVPAGVFPRNFHQYTVVGSADPLGMGVGLTVLTTPDQEIDRTQECVGNGIGSYFTQCIWRY